MSDQEESIGPGYWPRTRASLIIQLQDVEEDDPRREEIWAEFLNLYLPPIRRFCRRRLPVDDVEEVAHVVFLRIFRSLPKFRYDPNRGRFGGWVGMITRREIIRFVLKKQREGRLLGGVEIGDLVSGNEEAELLDEFNENLMRITMERARSQVSAENRRLFEATWKNEKKPGEVAAELNVSPSRVHKARFIVSEKIRQIITQIADDIPLPHDRE